MSQAPKTVIGYLPDERPPIWKLIFFALQQILVMFPATVLVAMLTGFHVSTTIFASGLSTLCFLLVTRGKIPLYYGSSFSYIVAIASITGVKGVVTFGVASSDILIGQAQFGIIMSGLVSIVAGLIINFFGPEKIEFVLPPTVTGSIAIVIGISLAGTAITGAAGTTSGAASNNTAWIIAIVTLLATVLFSVYLKGTLGQLPILFGILVGYALAASLGVIDFTKIFTGPFVAPPHFTLPVANWGAVAAIMPIAIATIPESTAHLYQLDIYVDHLAQEKGKKPYGIKNRLGMNLIGDGIGDIVSSLFGGPAGTNYGENLSTMAITRNFSVPVLAAAAVITMLISFFTPLSNLVNSIPGSVIGGVSIYLFGIIGAQGIAIMINRKVDLFDSRSLAVIATILVIGLGGNYGFAGGMIPFFGMQLPAIATAALVGIVLNLLLSIGRKKEQTA
ncbi:MAG: solute carrier family 23 protein [Clostridiaceae bacterium]|nr:solute carrier family 23 protein [Clostridiaceae bacterium]